MNRKHVWIGLGAIVSLAAIVLVAYAVRSGMATASRGAASSAVVSTITASEAKVLMEDGAPLVLLDVRTEEEFLLGHIPGAIWLPYTELADRAAEALPDHAARILLYCRSGRRSAEAAEILMGLAYTNVYDFGGIEDWPYDMVSG